MEDHLRGNNGVVEGNTTASHSSDPSEATRGQKFATAGGAFVVPTASGKPAALPVPVQASQTAPVALMQPSTSQQLEASQVGTKAPSTTNNVMIAPRPETLAAPDIPPSLANAVQMQSSSTAAAQQGATEAAKEGANKDDTSQSSSSSKKKKPKKDRSKLRKGKWTPEEEEYTSRIIHYFSSGILTLPEGTTLRAYLAEKLNCDPMRITKKYAGASCLGKRVYHLCDRAPATVTDVEVAKAELASLEQRFRLRVEHGQTGLPLPPRTDFLPGATNVFGAAGQVPAALLQTLAAANTAAAAPGAFPLAVSLAAGAPVGAPAAAWPGALPFLAQNALIPGAAPGVLPFLAPPNTQNNPLATWAWAQAAASLTPALSQLAAANLQQHQQELQKALDSRVQAIAQQSSGGTAAPASPAAAPAEQTPPRQTGNANLVEVAPRPPAVAAPTATEKAPAPVEPSNDTTRKQPTSPRSKEEEEAGSMLMGFLSSLRKGYEEALSEREKSEGALASQQSGHKRRASDELQASKRPRLSSDRPNSTERAETASGTTSYPAESSLEDSDDADGKGKNSSSEDSDKDSSERDSSGERGSSSGEGGSVPPRKRMKGKHTVGEFTTKNVAEHNHRMDVMRIQSQQKDPSSSLSPRWPRDA